MAFPRLNAFSFWLTAFGGFPLYFSLLGWEWIVWGWQCTRRRLVGLCSSDFTRVFPRP